MRYLYGTWRDFKTFVPLQGCLLAELLFVITMDPFVQLFNNAIVSMSVGVTCLCADDIAIALKSWAQLVDVYNFFCWLGVQHV